VNPPSPPLLKHARGLVQPLARRVDAWPSKQVDVALGCLVAASDGANERNSSHVRPAKNAGDLARVGKHTSSQIGYLAAGVDTTPLFEGLEGDLCQCPHWGFVLSGQLTTTDARGAQETVRANDLFYWPPGHNVRVDADAEIVMFSPQHEHSHVIEHMLEKVQAG
jgi:hypothetical protein